VSNPNTSLDVGGKGRTAVKITMRLNHQADNLAPVNIEHTLVD